MIKTLKLTNFRAVKDSTLVFSEGLQILRGANEIGKSTRLEAIMYALYGSRALRNSLANTVTYGLKDHQLKVEATFEFEGQDYLFIRHKGGAEVYVNGSHEPFVTGQTEVTTFAARLIGADAVTANKLMMASQGNLRGALEQGPKATAEMIEDLADFDLFDFLLAAMGRELALGSSTNLDRTITELEQTLDGFGQVDYDSQIREAEQNLAMLNEMIAREEVEIKVLDGQKNELNQQLNEVQKTNEHIGNLKVQKDEVETQLEKSEKELTQIQKVVEQGADFERIQLLQVEIAGAAETVRALRAYQKIVKLPSVDVEWEGDLASLKDHLKEKHERLGLIDETIRELSYQVRTLKDRVIKDKDCPTCGQEIESVEEINKGLQTQIEDLQAKLKSAEVEQQEVKTEEQELVKFYQTIQPTLGFVKEHAEYLDVDSRTVPPRFKWKGPAPTGVQFNLDEARVELVDLQKQADNFLQHQAKLKPVEELVNLHRAKARELAMVLESSHEMDATELQERLNTLTKEIKEAQDSLDQKKQSTLAFHTSIQNLRNRKEYEQTSKQQVEEQIKRIQSQVKDLEFNNNLLKKVRQARPLVSDQLWNMVLSAVSTMFTKIRGEQSVVSKDKDGFKVNGQDVAGLSGSTLDILGASIRVALIRTFIPNCPFVVYDEPFASMDENRATAMLTFIRSTGFKQTLVVTHEDLSENLADQLIILEN